jgi:hypothetical protein
MMTGATMVGPKGMVCGTPAPPISTLKMYFCDWVKPGPPYSCGQFGASQPFFASDFCH